MGARKKEGEGLEIIIINIDVEYVDVDVYRALSA